MKYYLIGVRGTLSCECTSNRQYAEKLARYYGATDIIMVDTESFTMTKEDLSMKSVHKP
jgi:hypothetical protein